ncbi:Holo-[acyl-carrier-protein] synthase [Fundidesulfovibrio magnetotacticus]|uniref:Holo-[acyl-carrier-protein] synthase n=1 Tax=Fundidesulfovibrio magnetotacticus TaxID=2730080 RepID=A0A6V8LRS6_9BACT|nr:holo-[acyl-carrier-protein] synthase [Fundidesulfovibrio magnetotacticus]GFK95173.1 Holo-[acyl-carrier-protein] synthase [Fundidesulfovibrio magnetotacticus]
MIVGLGIDVAELDRIRDSLERHGERFLHKILSEAEIAQRPRNAVPWLAARFAAKEAAAKALGTGISGGVTFKDIEILSEPSGRPVLRLSGAALERAKALGVTHSHVSLTHGRDTAAAVVALEAP